MTTIKKQSGSNASVARRALHWVLLSKRRTEAGFLVNALWRDPDDLELTADEECDIDINFVLKACRGLLTIDQGICKFSHLSVREYLELVIETEYSQPQSLYSITSGHGIITRSCLIHLSALRTRSRAWDLRKKITSDRFACYAVEFWMYHADQSIDLKEVQDEVKKFSDTSNTAYTDWETSYVKGYNFDEFSNFDEWDEEPEDSSPIMRKLPASLLYYSCLRSYRKLVNHLATSATNINQECGAFGSPLGASIAAGDRAVFENLIKHQDVNTNIGRIRPLTIAIAAEDEYMIEKLLLKDTEVNYTFVDGPEKVSGLRLSLLLESLVIYLKRLVL